MRIRKRQAPFPLSPVTLSDPNPINRSPVLVQLNDSTTTSPKPSCTHASATAPIPLSDRPPPSDQPLPQIGKPTHGCDDSSGEGGAHVRHHQKKQECLLEDGRGQEGEEGQKGNDTRKGGILSSDMPAEVFSPSSSIQDWRWCEGEKAFPLKKRRGSFENARIENSNNSNDNNKKKMKMKSRMKTKMNKKCYDGINEGDEEEEEEEEEVVVVVRETKPEVNVGNNKKKVRGGALMEGSRCSRVNGRGWRCCQPTLVGYSLCEHHLGKGRLRSMTSVRSRSVATAPPKNNNLHDMPLSHQPSISLSLEKQTKSCDDQDNDEKKPVMITKNKRMKLGMVKARSIRSLLGQTNTTEIAVAENNK